MWDISKRLGHFADVKVHLECAEKEKNTCHLCLLTPAVSEHVKLSGGKPQHLSGNKTGCSQPSGVSVPWGETETAPAMGMKNRHMPRRHVGDKAGTWSRTGLTVSAAQWCAKSWQTQVLIALRKR